MDKYCQVPCSTGYKNFQRHWFAYLMHIVCCVVCCCVWSRVGQGACLLGRSAKLSTERRFDCATCLQMCLVHKAGSLSVVEYGSNEVLAVCRTEHMSPYLLSAADVEARGTTPAVKRVAYLLDLQTIRVIDLLAGGQSLATISHDSKIDWLVSRNPYSRRTLIAPSCLSHGLLGSKQPK